jgi:hypothetical protein
MTIRVLIADDNFAIRQGLRLLELDPELRWSERQGTATRPSTWPESYDLMSL